MNGKKNEKNECQWKISIEGSVYGLYVGLKRMSVRPVAKKKMNGKKKMKKWSVSGISPLRALWIRATVCVCV